MTGTKRFHGLGACIVAVWVGWMVWMVVGDQAQSARAVLHVNEEALAQGFREGEEWQGLYRGDRKVGYVGMEKRMIDDGYAVETTMMLRMNVMGKEQELESVVSGEMGRDFVLRAFEADLEAGPARMKVRGRVEGGKVVRLKVHSGGGVQEETLRLQEPARMSFALAPTLMQRGLEPGTDVSYTYFDPSSMREKTTQVRYIGREALVVLGESVESYHWKQRVGSQEFALWTNDLGEVLRAELPMGLIAVRETREKAKGGVESGVGLGEDITAEVAIKPTGAPFRSKAPEAVLELRGVQWEGLSLDGGRQSWSVEEREGEDGQVGVLTLRVEGLSQWSDERVGEATARAEKHKDGAQWLEPELMVQSDHEDIRSKALGILGVERVEDVRGMPVVQVVGKVSKWVYGALKKENVVGVPSALETLKTLRGDCNEHATLMVALLRSVGVPSRIAVGAAWLDSRERFLYHAWVEVRVGSSWVAVDPTFGQFPADIGHIRFVAGGLRDQMEMFRVMGHVDVRVVAPPVAR